MERAAILAYVADTYGTQPEYLWRRLPNYLVFRHADNRKWYGLIMDVKAANLGLAEPGNVDVMNIKLPPEQVELVQKDPGVFPAYHMSKNYWVSLRLSQVAENEAYRLIDASYQQTKG